MATVISNSSSRVAVAVVVVVVAAVVLSLLFHLDETRFSGPYFNNR